MLDDNASVDYWNAMWAQFRSSQWVVRDIPLAVPPPVGATLIQSMAADWVELDRDAFLRLRRSASEHGLSLEIYTLAAYAIALARHTYRTRFPVWVAYSLNENENTALVRQTDGLYMIGCDLGKSQSVDEFVQDLRYSLQDAHGHAGASINLCSRAVAMIGARGQGAWISYDYQETDNVDERLPLDQQLDRDQRPWTELIRLTVAVWPSGCRLVLSYPLGICKREVMRALLKSCRDLCTALTDGIDCRELGILGCSPVLY